MFYTIMILDSVHDGLKVELNKKGNQYSVTLYNEYVRERTTKTFDELMDAVCVFERLTRAIGTGSFDYKTRKSWLE